MNRARVVAGWSALVCAVIVVSHFVFGDSWRTAVEYGLISLVLTIVLHFVGGGLIIASLNDPGGYKGLGVLMFLGVAAVECGGDLFVLAKGCRKILRLPVAAAEQSLQS